MDSNRLRLADPAQDFAPRGWDATLAELSRLCVAEKREFGGLFAEVENRLKQLPPSCDYARVPAAIHAIILSHLPPDEPRRILRAQRHVMAQLLIANAPRLLQRYKQPRIAPHMARNFNRIATSLLNSSEEYADYDFFLKDVNYACGEYIQCGAQAISLTAKVSIKSLLCKQALAAYPSLSGWTAAASRLGRGWFRTHTDSRIMEDFDEAGWQDFYRAAAVLLKDRPDIFGVVSTCWFFDPQILTVSPRLAYLQSNPLRHGAFLFRHGPGPQHTAWAIEKSETRRRLVEKGSYLPICYSLTWPRQTLCDWAGV